MSLPPQLCAENLYPPLLLGWLILNEEINMRIIVSSSLIIAGIAFIKIGDKPLKKLELSKTGKYKKAA